MATFAPMGHYTFNAKDQILVATISGVYNLEGAKTYSAELKQEVKNFNDYPWAFIGDINHLGLSAMEAVQEIQALIPWMKSHGCLCFVNVSEKLSMSLDFQVRLAKGDEPMFEAKTLEQVFEICEHALKQQATG
jgi:hypothetical protein